MKKKIIALFIVAIVSTVVSIACVIFALSYFSDNNAVVNAVSENANISKNLPAYKSIYGDKFVNSSNKNVDFEYNIEADISFSNNKALIKETIYFLNNFDCSIEKNSNTIFLFVPSINNAITKINRISSSKELLNNKQNGLILEIQINDVGNVNLNDSLNNVIIEYEVLLNQNIGTISQSDRHIFLTNFLITPAVFKDGKPLYVSKSRFGDPYIYNMNNYKINFTVDENYSVFAPGIRKENPADNSKKNISFEAKYLRDFPVVILGHNRSANSVHLKKDDVQIEKFKDVEIYYINSYESKEYVKEAFAFAYEYIGAYPYDKFFVVKANMDLRGMEFSNMIFLSTECFKNNELLKKVTYHEIFHQWFYGIIGTDQVNEPFLDEGIVNYLAMYLAGEKLGNNYDSSFVKKDLKDYVSKNEYYKHAYDNATAYFANIHQQLGNKFFDMLKKIYVDKKFSTLYYDEFLDYLNKFSQGGN